MAEEKVVAYNPEDLAHLLVKRMNQGDNEGTAALYEEDAILSTGPDGQMVVGRNAISAFYGELAAKNTEFEVGNQRPALINGDIALTSTRLSNGTITAEIARRQSDGSWLWVLDEPALAKSDGN